MTELVDSLPPPLRRYPTWDVLAAIESSSSSTHTTSSTAQLSDGTDPKHRENSDRDDVDAPLVGAGDSVSQCDTGNNRVIQDAWQNVLLNHRDSVPQLQKAAARLRWLQAHTKGAHVVAPCAHDGVCPMDTPGQTAWCHFSQRVERRYLHRQCAPKHSRACRSDTQPHTIGPLVTAALCVLLRQLVWACWMYCCDSRYRSKHWIATVISCSMVQRNGECMRCMIYLCKLG